MEQKFNKNLIKTQSQKINFLVSPISIPINFVPTSTKKKNPRILQFRVGKIRRERLVARGFWARLLLYTSDSQKQQVTYTYLRIYTLGSFHPISLLSIWCVSTSKRNVCNNPLGRTVRLRDSLAWGYALCSYVILSSVSCWTGILIIFFVW